MTSSPTGRPTPALDHRARAAAIDVLDLYRDLHAHPELAFREKRTAAVVAERLTTIGLEVRTEVGGTGVVGILRNGTGPTVLLRADMDALPIEEATGLPYAAPAGPDAAMHACGHDMHVASLVGALDVLTERRSGWRGTVVAVFQPAEEIGEGAQAMVDDGLAELVPRPDVCLGQHVGPLPVGVVVSRGGALMAAADSLRVRLHGRGGHASSPETTIDPVLLAASVITRLQGIVAREVRATDPAVVTVAAVHAGDKENVIPETAELTLNVRSFAEPVRERILAAVRRIVVGEAEVSGALREPEFETISAFPVTVNDGAATTRTLGALSRAGLATTELPQPLSASEDFGRLAEAFGCPSVFWHWGGTDPAAFSDDDLAGLRGGKLPDHVPTNHSPRFAPAPEPTLTAGITAMVAAAEEWLGTAAGDPAEPRPHERAGA